MAITAETILWGSGQDGSDRCVWDYVTVGEDVEIEIGSAAAREGAAM